LITFESSLGVEPRVVSASGGRATARLRAIDAAGDLRVGAAFVRDGSLEWNTVPIELAAAGRPRVDRLVLGNALFAAGEAAHVTFADGALHSGTFIVRISRGTPSGSARFASAPALLAIGVATTQTSAPESVTWHPWVNSSGEHAQILGFVRRSQPPPELSVAQAETQAVAWDVMRSQGKTIAVSLPAHSGSYELSVLGIADDGSVSAASSTITVR